MVDKLTNPEGKIRDRLEIIDAGLDDLAELVRSYPTGKALTKKAMAVHRKRLSSLILGIYHLKDDVKGLAKLRGLSKNIVDDFITASPAITLCVKAGDTYKHGVGGRSGNNTVMGYEIHIHKQEKDKPRDSDPLVGLVMLMVDENGEPHQSDLLVKEALCDWLSFLFGLGVDVSESAKKWRPQTLPRGMSHYTGKLAPAFLKHVKDEAKNRGN